MIKQKFKKIIPAWFILFSKCVISAFRLFPENVYWFYKDILQSNLISDYKSDLSSLMTTSHVLEKGITMPKRRLGFGYDRVRIIIDRCTHAIELYTENHIEIQSTLNDLRQYLYIHQQQNYTLPRDIYDGINRLLKYKHQETKDCYNITKDRYFSQTADFKEFANQRHSVRWYSDEKIDDNIVINAIELAQTAPSACNRQSTRVYVIKSDDKKQQVLSLQNGNRGFGHGADKILLLTSDMKCWNYKHRTSAFLDTGIFTMNLLYALHYYKICVCTLNAHLSIKQRGKLRKIVGYSKSEIPVVFLSIGQAPDHFWIAGSQRINTKQMCVCV